MLPRIWLRYHRCRGAGWAYRLIVVCWLWVVSYVGILRFLYHAIGDTLLMRWRWSSLLASESFVRQPPCQIGCCATLSGQQHHWGMMHGAWWRLWQNRRNKTRRQVFLHDGTLRIDWSWRSPLSYGHNGSPLPAFKHATISQHTMQQVYVEKLEKLSLIMFIS